MLAIDFVSVAGQWVPALLVAAARAAILILLAAGLTAMVTRASAATRHGIWAAAVLGALAMPFVSPWLPGWEILPAPDRAPGAVPVSAAAGVVADALPITVEADVAPPPAAGSEPVVSVGAVIASRTGLPAAGDGGSVPVRADWPSIVLVVWWVGAALVLSMLAVSLARLWGCVRWARPFPHADWQAEASRTAKDLGIRRPIRLFASRTASTPMTWGIWRPVVLLPEDAAGWSAARRRDVLRHEFAHIERHDYLLQLLSRVTCALYWFNPLVWIAARQLRIEREQACDDAVLAAGSQPSEYAGHLLAIARSMKASPAVAFAAVPMARPSQLANRVQAVLADDRNHGAPGRMGVAMRWVGAGVVFSVVACARTASSDPVPVAPEPTYDASVADALVADAPSPPPVVRRRPATLTPEADRYFRVTPAERAATVSPRQQRAVWAAAPNCREGVPNGRGISENVNDERRNSRWWDGDCEGTVTIRGEVRFTPDYRDIRSLGGDGRFSIEIDDGSIVRRVDVRRGADGLERRWYVDGDQAPYEAEAAAWLGRALEDFFRHSSYALDERVDRILRTRGITGLLDEADLAHGGYLKRRYYAAAIETGQLDPAAIRTILARAARDIASDHEMGRLLRSIPASAIGDPELQRSYLQAANTLESDHERRRVLSEMLTQPRLADDVVIALLQSAAEMESDHELGRLLREVGGAYLRNPATQAAYLEATRGLESDHELRRVLSALLEIRELEPQTRLTLLETAGAMESDHELGRLLRDVAGTFVIDDTLRPAFFRAVGTLDSDHERGRVLDALRRRAAGSDEQLTADVLGAAAGLQSDHELEQLLVRVTNGEGIRESYRELFFAALDRLDSDHSRQQVLRTLGRRTDLPAAAVADALAAIDATGSEHARTELIVQYARRYRADETVRERLVAMAERLASEASRRRALDALGIRRR